MLVARCGAEVFLLFSISRVGARDLTPTGTSAVHPACIWKLGHAIASRSSRTKSQRGAMWAFPVAELT